MQGDEDEGRVTRMRAVLVLGCDTRVERGMGVHMGVHMHTPGRG